jgi:hypothetical protein
LLFATGGHNHTHPLKDTKFRCGAPIEPSPTVCSDLAEPRLVTDFIVSRKANVAMVRMIAQTQLQLPLTLKKNLYLSCEIGYNNRV